jgi:hypothetical protein
VSHVAVQHETHGLPYTYEKSQMIGDITLMARSSTSALEVNCSEKMAGEYHAV